MLGSFKGCLLAVLLFPLFCSAGTVHYMVMEDQGRPFQIEDAGTAHSGIITDLVYEIFRDGPHSLVTHTFPYLRMRANMQSGEYPNWLRYGSPVWGPLNDNLSDQAVVQAENILLVRKDSGIAFHTIQDLFGHQLILMRGFSYRELEPYLKAKQISDIRATSFATAYEMLNRGRGAAVSDVKIRMRYNAHWLGLVPEEYEVLDFSSVIPNYEIFLNMDPQMDPEIESFINQRLSVLKASGFVETLLLKYGPSADQFRIIQPGQ